MSNYDIDALLAAVETGDTASVEKITSDMRRDAAQAESGAALSRLRAPLRQMRVYVETGPRAADLDAAMLRAAEVHPDLRSLVDLVRDDFETLSETMASLESLLTALTQSVENTAGCGWEADTARLAADEFLDAEGLSGEAASGTARTMDAHAARLAKEHGIAPVFAAVGEGRWPRSLLEDAWVNYQVHGGED